MKGVFPIEKFKAVATPFYYYDTALLRKTLEGIKAELGSEGNYHLHYAIKANANPQLLRIIREAGFGADCVSGGEIKAALAAGFPAAKIVFAGVGKAIGKSISRWMPTFSVSMSKAYRNLKLSTSWQP